jgi:hypothetical protein
MTQFSDQVLVRLGRGQAQKKASHACVAGTRGLTCAGTLVTVHDMPKLALATRHGDRQWMASSGAFCLV